MESGYDSRPDTYEHIEKVRALLLGCAVNLISRAHRHDASKLEEPELSTFDEYTPKLRATTYGSDEYKDLTHEMGVGLDHHYAVNRHHPEWHRGGIQGMNLLDLTEMLADWKAATLRHDDGDLGRSIELNQQRFRYGDELKRLLLNTARDCGWIAPEGPPEGPVHGYVITGDRAEEITDVAANVKVAPAEVYDWAADTPEPGLGWPQRTALDTDVIVDGSDERAEP